MKLLGSTFASRGQNDHQGILRQGMLYKIKNSLLREMAGSNVTKTFKRKKAIKTLLIRRQATSGVKNPLSGSSKT